MFKRYYFYSANLHSNNDDPSDITGYISGIVIFESWFPFNPLMIRRMTSEFICKKLNHLKDEYIHFIVLEKFKN